MPAFMTALTPADLAYHKRLLERKAQAEQGLDAAHAALSRANMHHAAITTAVSLWLEELTPRYGLKALDAVGDDGSLHYLDPAWREEVAREAAEGTDAPEEVADQAFFGGPEDLSEVAAPVEPEVVQVRAEEPPEEFAVLNDPPPARPHRSKSKPVSTLV